MDDHKMNCKGSPSRDAFKQWHKLLGDELYACDLDFVLVSKHPPGIVAVFDYKRPDDDITFSEVLAYNKLKQDGIPLYIVVGEYDPDNGKPFSEFEVYRYLGGNWAPDPPTVKKELVTLISAPPGTDLRYQFREWEKKLRQDYELANRHT